MDQQIKRRGFIGAAVGMLAAIACGRVSAIAPAADSLSDEICALCKKYGLDSYHTMTPGDHGADVRMLLPRGMHETDRKRLAEVNRHMAEVFDPQPATPKALVTDAISDDQDAYHDDCRAVANKWGLDLYEFLPGEPGVRGCSSQERQEVKDVRILAPKNFHIERFVKKLRIMADYYDQQGW